METEDETVSRRGCRRRFVLLLDGGVAVRWECGTEKVIRDECAVDVEYLADHLPQHHHHRHHLHPTKEPHEQAIRT